MNTLERKSARAEYRKRWYAANREILIAKSRAKYLENREQRLAKQKEYHSRKKSDPEYRGKRIARQRLRRKERSLFWREYKSKLSCEHCGESRTPCLDFHHLDPKEKDFNPGKAIAEFVPISEVMEEVKKCVVLCANCHRMVHANEYT